MAATTRVAIIGGGVSGCASARRLAQLVPSAAQITLYEIGRGPGGRASTRKTRSFPHLYINHGAPYADIRSKLGKSLVSSLDVATFGGVRGSLNSETGKFLGDKEDDALYITGSDGEMSTIATSLLNIPSIETKYKTMIRGLSRSKDGEWELLDKSRKMIGVADWLVVAGSGITHPRWTDTFGGEPPLIQAEKECPDEDLRQALDMIAQQLVSPRLAVFFSCSSTEAQRWLSLDYNVANVTDSSVLSRAMIQTDEDNKEWCSIVLHSTEEFALKNTGVYGSTSSAARVGDASSDVSREEELIQEMTAAWNEIPNMPDIKKSDDYDYGPVLHRWGNSFPKGKALPENLSFLPESRVVFCGDYVASPEQPRFGSFESALLSGTHAGELIAEKISNE